MSEHIPAQSSAIEERPGNLQDLEAEMWTIGTASSVNEADQNTMMADLNELGVASESFADPMAQSAFGSVRERVRLGNPVNFIEIVNDMVEAKFDRDTAEIFLTSCMAKATTITHARFYAVRLKDAERRRVLWDAGREIAVAIKVGTSPDAVTEMLVATTDGLRNSTVGGLFRTRFPPIRFSDLQAYDPAPEVNHIAGRGWLRRRKWTLLTGGTGIGKSVLAEQLAGHIACGVPFMGLTISSRFRVLFLTAENDEEVLKRDLLAIAEHDGLDGGLLDANLDFHHAYAISGAELQREIEAEMRRGAFDLLVLDNYQAYSDDDINDSQAWKMFISPLDSMLNRLNAGMLLIDHSGKPTERKYYGINDSPYLAAGTSRKANGARASAELYSPIKGDTRYKFHYGKNWERAGVVDEFGSRVRDIYLDRSPSAEAPYWTPSADQTEHKPMVDGEAEILNYADQHPEAGYRAIAKATGCSKSKVGDIFKKYPLRASGRAEE